MQQEIRSDQVFGAAEALMFGKLSAIVYAPGQAVPGSSPGLVHDEERRINKYVEIYCGSGSGSGSGSGGCHGELPAAPPN